MTGVIVSQLALAREEGRSGRLGGVFRCPSCRGFWAFGNQLDAWASGLGDWGECEADDDDDFDEPGAWRDSMALDDCDA